jgi:hypothetical protein
MKPEFPEVAPVIEVWPGVHATLMADFSRYSNGSIPFMGSFMTANSEGKQIGEIGADGGGRWVVKVEEAWYSVNMGEAFEAFQNAHIATL